MTASGDKGTLKEEAWNRLGELLGVEIIQGAKFDGNRENPEISDGAEGGVEPARPYGQRILSRAAT